MAREGKGGQCQQIEPQGSGLRGTYWQANSPPIGWVYVSSPCQEEFHQIDRESEERLRRTHATWKPTQR